MQVLSVCEVLPRLRDGAKVLVGEGHDHHLVRAAIRHHYGVPIDAAAIPFVPLQGGEIKGNIVASVPPVFGQKDPEKLKVQLLVP